MIPLMGLLVYLLLFHNRCLKAGFAEETIAKINTAI